MKNSASLHKVREDILPFVFENEAHKSQIMFVAGPNIDPRG